MRIWMHPRRTARELEALLEEQIELRAAQQVADEEMAALRGELEVCRQETAGVREEFAEAKATAERLSVENALMSDRLKVLEGERAEWQRLESEMESLNDELDKIAAMKVKYEQRIERLQQQLQSQQSAAGRHHKERRESEEESELIDMSDTQPKRRLPPIDGKARYSRRNRPQLPDADADPDNWLKTLPTDL